MSLSSGSVFITAGATISGAAIAPQGNAVSNTLNAPGNDQSLSGNQRLTFGTASGQADILCAAQYTLAGAGTQTFDLFANGIPDVFGGAANFRKLKSIAIAIVSGGDASGLIIGAAASNATPLFFGNQNDTWTISPNGPAFLGGSPDGVVIDATHRNLKITNGSASVPVTFNVFLAGTSV